MGANNQRVYPKWKQYPCRTSEHKCHVASNWSETKSGLYPQAEASLGCYIRSTSHSSVHSSWWQTLAAPWYFLLPDLSLGSRPSRVNLHSWPPVAMQDHLSMLAHGMGQQWWNGFLVLQTWWWAPGPPTVVGGASAMDPNEHFYSRSQGIYTLHLTLNTLKSKEIVTGKRN